MPFRPGSRRGFSFDSSHPIISFVSRPALLGTYSPPSVRRGDRVTCLYRDADCIVTGMHDGRIPWPRVQIHGQHGGSGLLVNETMLQAILTESAAALMYWFGVGSKAVWNWRRTFLDGPGKFRTPGSREAHQRASNAGAEAVAAKAWTAEERAAKSALSKRLGLSPPVHIAGRTWTAKELRMLGTASDIEIAERTGRSVDAVRAKRRRCRP